MKYRIRFLFALLTMFPIISLHYLISLFMSQKRVFKFLGPMVCVQAKSFQRFYPPKIKCAADFDHFEDRMKRTQRLWRKLYDYEVESPDCDTVQTILTRCPFAEVLTFFRLSGYGSYMCQGDWKVAEDNSDKWSFERKTTLATGGKVCDFTYRRLKA